MRQGDTNLPFRLYSKGLGQDHVSVLISGTTVICFGLGEGRQFKFGAYIDIVAF